MSPPTPRGPAAVNVVAVSDDALARQVETVRGTVERLRGMPAQVAELARVVGTLAEQVAAVAGPAHLAAPPSWLVLEPDVQLAQQMLARLTGWLGEVYLRYADAAASFPDCWLWHPDVVEELLCLMSTWRAAYCGPTASAQAAGDWHDRSRPGVVRRIKTLAGSCSLDNHQPRPGHTRPGGTVVPGAEALAAIADWWALRRRSAAPEPTDVHLAAIAAVDRTHQGGRQ